MTISIHPGHFGKGTGASHYIDEGKEAIKVAKRVHELVKPHLKSVYIQDTVSRGQSANINWLVARMNNSGASTHYSIHFNSTSPRVGPVGTETIVYSEKNYKHAKELSDAMAKAGGFKNRGVKYNKRLGVLRNTRKPAYLLEVCFVSSKKDVELYRKNFDKICRSIADTILAHHGIKKQPPKKEVNEVDKKEFEALKQQVEALQKLVGNGKAGKSLASTVERAVELGITDGSNMGHPITREQAAAMIVRLYDLLK